jgi:hypothetical protein
MAGSSPKIRIAKTSAFVLPLAPQELAAKKETERSDGENL